MLIMIYNTLSSEEVIYDIFDKYGVVASDWTPRAARWIADGLEQLGCPGIWQPCSTIEEVIDYKAKVPCNIKVLRHIEYNGAVLPMSGSSNHQDNSTIDSRNTTSADFVMGRNGYIHTSFETGEVIFHHLCPQIEFSKRYNMNIPKIPDNVYVKEALTWLVFRNVLSRGYIHHTYSLESRIAELNPSAMWERTRTKARIKLMLPDEYEREQLSAIWKTMWLSPNSFYHTSFDNSAGSGSSLTSTTSLNTYAVNFVINVDGANVTISPDPGVTLASGVYSLTVYRVSDSYSYTVSKSGYTTQSGTFAVNDNDVLKHITLV